MLILVIVLVVKNRQDGETALLDMIVGNFALSLILQEYALSFLSAPQTNQRESALERCIIRDKGRS